MSELTARDREVACAVAAAMMVMAMMFILGQATASEMIGVPTCSCKKAP